MPGENAPPLHPNCRCSTAAWMDDRAYEEWLDSGAAADGVSFKDFSANYKAAGETGPGVEERRKESAIYYEGPPKSWHRIKDGENAGLEVINPNFKKMISVNATKEETAYNRNCVNAVIAYDLRKRGWDVQARSYLECDLRRKAQNAWEGVKPTIVKENAGPILEKMMVNWGDNGRAFVGIGKDNKGHALVAELRNNRVILIDPQRNMVYTKSKDIRKLLKDGCECWRIDILEVSQTGFNACRSR